MGCRKLLCPSLEVERPRLFVPGRFPARKKLWPFHRQVEPYAAVAHVHTDTTGTTASSGATIVITTPTGALSTEIVLAVFGSNETGAVVSPTVSTPAGWTRIGPAGGVEKHTTNGVYTTAFWALGNVSGKTFTLVGDTGQSVSWVCVGFSGVDTTTAIDVADATGNSADGAASLTVNSVTIATTNAWECLIAADWLGGVYTATGFTVSPSSVVNCAMALLYNTTPKATGATGTVTLNDSAASTGQTIVGLSFALRSAGFIAPPPFMVSQAVHRASRW